MYLDSTTAGRRPRVGDIHDPVSESSLEAFDTVSLSNGSSSVSRKIAGVMTSEVGNIENARRWCKDEVMLVTVLAVLGRA